MTALLAALRRAVGKRHVLTSARATARYRKGYRTGEGPALAVVRPGSLLELWRVVRACVAADVSIIMQASNTGLTGGSTPDGGDYPGGLVIISTTRLSALRVIRGGEQVLCMPGTTLNRLEQALRPFGRGAAFGDRIVLPWRFGGGGRVQQFGWIAGATRTGLYRDGALRTGAA